VENPGAGSRRVGSDLPKVLLEAAAAIASVVPTIEVALNIEEEIAPVLVFRSLVADILRNLVTNAMQAMSDKGKICLCARNAGRYVALNVIDTGVGIPPEKLSIVFDLFFSDKKQFRLRPVECSS